MTPIEHIKLLTNNTAEPVLTDDEITSLLTIHETFPGTYDLTAAVSAAWRLKAAKLVHLIDTEDGDKRLKLEQFYKHCIEMAEYTASSAREASYGKVSYIRLKSDTMSGETYGDIS